MALPLMGIYLGKTKNRQDTGTQRVVLLCLQKPSLGYNLNVLGKKKMDKADVVLMYNGILLSLEISEIRPLEANRVDLYTIVLSDISQTEKYTYHITYSWNLKMATLELNYKTETVTHLENTLMAAKVERWGGERHKPGG